ncbi:MAG: glycosyltransferase family 4 protein [Desulfuromonadaceae bacterium]|nr:glycosyltransferase family 4 protein [Desulfuromonadaceae bacterium]
MNDKIKVLVLDNTFTFGGAINSLCHLINALDKERFEPIIVTGQREELLKEKFTGTTCYNHMPRLPWIDNHNYTKIASLPFFKNSMLRFILNLSRFLYWVFLVDFSEALYFRRIGKRHGVQLVHLNNIMGSQLSGIMAAKLLGVPCVAHLRDFEEVHPITKFYARLVDHHVAISGAIKDNLLLLGVSEEKISVVHDALDLDEFNGAVHCNYLVREFGLESGKLRYGIFGRVVDWKGIREFLHAARIIADQFPEACGFIVGGPSDGDVAFYDEMVVLAYELGLKDKVVFTGYRKDIPALMKLMDVVVHASNRPEPFGMVVIEGMAMGKPVVATRAGGPIDIVADGRTGLLVDVGDEVALAEAVIALLQQIELRQKMGRLGRERVEELFNNKLYAEKMQKIFQRFTP